MHYMSTPLSIRFDPALLERLRRHARAVAGGSVSTLAQTLIDEGLRMAEHPGIVFKSGPSGRRAALANGPDIWEIAKFLHEVDERGPAAVSAAGEVLGLPESRVRTALRYYADYETEIEAEIALADAESAAAEAAWNAEQRLLR
jgi:hypothetical protein